MCHAAAAFFTSPYKSSLIFSFDGQGTDGYTVFFNGEGNKIKRIRSYDYQLGHSYVFARKIVNEDLGYEESAPGKLMGLAAYNSDEFGMDAYNVYAETLQVDGLGFNYKTETKGRQHLCSRQRPRQLQHCPLPDGSSRL